MSQKTIKVVIAEDEPSNRSFLRRIIEQQPDIEVIGEAENGMELVSLAQKLRPQAVFVDIEMPEMDGMSAVKQLLESNEDLVVVFVTGHPDFAVEAFEISSFDYILKPFNADRVRKTVEKMRRSISAKAEEINKLHTIFKSTNKLYVKSGHELHFVDAGTILYIEKEKKKTVIHTTGGKYETNEAINILENRLGPMDFFRSHRCYLINLKMVEKIVPWGANSYLVKFFNSNNDALISRSKVKMLYKILDIGME